MSNLSWRYHLQITIENATLTHTNVQCYLKEIKTGINNYCKLDIFEKEIGFQQISMPCKLTIASTADAIAVANMAICSQLHKFPVFKDRGVAHCSKTRGEQVVGQIQVG